MGLTGWSGGQARQLKVDNFVSVTTAQICLKGRANSESANEAGNKETINLALDCLCFLFRITAEYV